MWRETNGTDKQVRLASYNENDSSPQWFFEDGNDTTTGINKITTRNAGRPQLTVFNSKLYSAWEEAGQIIIYVGN